MKAKTVKKFGTVVGVILMILFVVAVFAVSWIATCGIIKLITLCFGWEFSWGIATGVWLLMCLARTVFKNDVTVKK